MPGAAVISCNALQPGTLQQCQKEIYDRHMAAKPHCGLIGAPHLYILDCSGCGVPMAHTQIVLSAVTEEFARVPDTSRRGWFRRRSGKAPSYGLDDPGSIRAQLRKRLQRPNVVVHVQTDFIKTGVPTLVAIYDYIKGCDMVIHLVGCNVGASPDAHHVRQLKARYPDLAAWLKPIENDAPSFSYTQWEAYLAIYLQKSLLVFVPNNGAVLDRTRTDTRQEKLQDRHIERLKQLFGLYPEEFESVDTLVTKILESSFLDEVRPDHSAVIDVAAIYYELTASVAADFSPVRPGTLARLHNRVGQEIRKAAHGARGIGQGKRGGYVVELLGKGEEPAEPKEKHQAIARLAAVATAIADDFQRIFNNAKEAAREAACDIRLVVVGGRAHRIHWGRHTQTVDTYVGGDLDVALQRLSAIGGGEVSVIGLGPRELDPDKFYRLDLRGSDQKQLGTTAWHYQRPWRPASDDVVFISPRTIEELSKPLLAGGKADELTYHKSPKNYGDIRERLLNRKLVILVGAPGIGKSLCGLRLVAELYQQGRCIARMPRMAETSWDHLRPRPSREVILLDDAFGKSFVRHRDYLNDAKQWFSTFLGLSAAADDESDADNESDDGQWPYVIMTVREEIWKAVKREWKGREEADTDLEGIIATHVFTLDEAYGEFGALFQDLVMKLGSARTKSRDERILANIAKRVDAILKHPMNVRDFFAELNQEGFDFERVNETIKQYGDANPKARYLRELEESIPSEDLPRQFSDFTFFFFMQVFSNAFLRKSEIEGLFFDLATATPPLIQLWGEAPDQVWSRHEARKERWGRWSKYGHFTASHPLREEALQEFFAKATAGEAVDRLFARFAGLAKQTDSDDRVLRAAAFAAPKLGGHLRPVRRAIMDMVTASEGRHGPAVSLASAIGHALSAERDHPTIRLMEGDLRDYLICALRTLLMGGGPAAAAAAAAVCDSASGDSELGKETLAPDLLRLVEAAASGEKATADVKEEIAWAIVSNFEKLPKELREMLLALTRDRDDWVRLRSLEAIADYYGEIKEMKGTTAFLRQFDQEFIRGAKDSAPIVARGLAGAFEENQEWIPEAMEWLLQMARAESLGVLEWVIWAIGEFLEKAMELKRDQTVEVFTRLALHQNARVRVWVARTLAENPRVLQREADLSHLLARLANDPSEPVWSAASEAFFKRGGRDDD